MFCVKKNMVISNFGWTVLLLNIAFCSTAASTPTVTLNIDGDGEGILIYLYNKGLPMELNIRMSVSPCSPEKSLNVVPDGEIGLEILDEHGERYHNKRHIIRRKGDLPRFFYRKVYPNHIVGIKIAYYQLIRYYHLEKCKTYKIRAIYMDSVKNAIKKPLFSNWITIKIPENFVIPNKFQQFPLE